MGRSGTPMPQDKDWRQDPDAADLGSVGQLFIAANERVVQAVQADECHPGKIAGVDAKTVVSQDRKPIAGRNPRKLAGARGEQELFAQRLHSQTPSSSDSSCHQDLTMSAFLGQVL